MDFSSKYSAVSSNTKLYLGFLLQTSLNLRENLENQEMLNDQMTSEQEKAKEQISIMQ